MAEDVAVMQDKTSKACCAALTKKHSKLLEKYSKLEELKNKFRICTELVQEKYDVVEKENGVLKKALEELTLQANIWKSEKEKECDRCVDLDDEISALKEEIQLLKQNQKSASQDPDKEIKERLNVAEKELKHLKELLEKERERAASEKKNAELEKKKADEALKKVEAGKKKVFEAQEIQERFSVSEKEIKHLEELLEKETERAASEKKNAELEKKKADEALKKVEAGKKKVVEAQEIQERLNVSEKEIKHLKELLEKERERAASEKKNAELEKKKADEALKKAEVGKKKVVEAQEIQERLNVSEKEIKHLKELLDKEREQAALEKKNVELEKKKADEDLKKVDVRKKKVVEAQKEIQERLIVSEKEIKHLKELLDKEREQTALEKKKVELEKKKAEEALKKVETGKKKVIEAQKAANVEKKKAEENRLLFEKLKMETDALESMLASERSKTEAADKKMEAEKQKAIRERKRADMADAKFEEQRGLAETNLKKAMLEKDRADDLNQKLDQARSMSEKLKEEIKILRSENIVEAQADKSKTGKDAVKLSDACVEMLKDDAKLSKWMEKILLEKDRNIIREKKRADSEKKKAKKQKKVAEAHKKLAMEQKHRAEQLYNELERYKLRLIELQKELQESVSRRINAENAPLRNNEIISGTDTVRLLKKRLKLEKMLVKHANETAKVEALRTNMLHREVCYLKQECVWFQQRLDLLDKSFLHGHEGTHHLGKIGNQTSPRETLHSDGYHRPLVSGIDSGMDPPYRGSNPKMLQSSAINSCSTSFSDRTLVGSQERRMISVTTSDKLGEEISNLKPTISRLSDKRRMRYNEHALAKADNSMRSPIEDNENEKRVGYSGKKRLLDAVESIENSYSKSEKLHRRVSEKLSLLHGLLNDQKDEHEEILKGNCSGKLVKPSKRRKTCEGMIEIHRLEDSGEPKNILDLDIVHSDVCTRASPPEVVVMKSGLCCKDGSDDKVGSNQCRPEDFDEMATHDYMKLLDLDDATDESAYCRAIAMPLSPMLPELEIHGVAELEVENPEMPVYKSSQEGSSNEMDRPASSSSFPMIDMEKDPTNLVINDLVSSQLQPSQDSVDYLKSTGSVMGSIHVTDGKLGRSDLSGSENKETNVLFERGIASTNLCLLRYFVLPSDHEDNSSILRILQTISSCMPRCSFLHSTEIFLRSVLHAISRAEDLPMKEKVCVFFSLVLHRISEAGKKNSTYTMNDKLVQCFDSVTQHIRTALSDPVLRRTFMESCDLFELFGVIENFILHRNVFVCGEVSGKPEAVNSFKVHLVPNDNAIMVSQVVASSQLLVAGGCLLASLCFAVDQIGFVCEMSCNIITMQKFERPVMLAILHAFAHVCGSKYFTVQRYSIAMTVVKSLVVFLEKQTLSNKSTSFWPSMIESQSKSWLCSNNCPFSKGALSMEDVALLLLENLQKHGRSKCWRQDLLLPRVGFEGERAVEVSCLRESVLQSFTSDENLCDFTDILSLVEILAYCMSWDWTFDHIIDQICEYLESHLMEDFSAAIVVLLGQLGRLGVGASGYEDARVKKLRKRLSAFVCHTTFGKLNLSVQFAVITSLFGLTMLKFEEIVEDKVENPAATSQSIPASSVREWFFGLSHEQQSLFKLHQAGNEEQP